MQRTTITAVVKVLQQSRLVSYRRGRIEILNRRGIEEIACECYSAVEMHSERLLKHHII